MKRRRAEQERSASIRERAVVGKAPAPLDVRTTVRDGVFYWQVIQDGEMICTHSTPLTKRKEAA